MNQSLAALSFPEAPKIVVKPPGPKAIEFAKQIGDYIPPQVYSMLLPMIWDSAKGATVRDVDGNTYIDFTAGFHAASTGFCHPKVTEAVRREVERLSCPPATWQFELRYEVAKSVAELCPPGLDKVLYAASGTEAVEMAVKVARFFTKKQDIVCLHGHYHGKGFLATLLTDPEWGTQNKDYGPYPSGVLHAPSPHCYRCPFKKEYPECDLVCADYVGEVIKAESPGNVAAVILEPWARVGGTPKGYLPRVKKICEENGVLFIADEITCGCGRSGKWWYCNYEGVVPDILITGKGIVSGIVPVSFIVTTKEIADGLPYSINEGQTFGAVPAACAAVSATIDVIKELKLVENAASVGDYMKKRLQEMTNEHKLLGNVSAAGLEITLDIVKNKETKEPVFVEGVELGTKLWEKGLLTYGPWFYWTPPLVLTRQQAEKGLDIFEEALSEVERQ